MNIIEEEIKISKEQNTPLLCEECNQELTSNEYREGEGLCKDCIRNLKD